MFAAYSIAFASFCELVLLKIPYGVLHGVFEKEEGVQVFDVFLPNKEAEMGRTWLGHAYIRNGDVFEGLRALHRSIVLNQRVRYRAELRAGGDVHCQAPDPFVLKCYRTADIDQLVERVDAVLSSPKPRVWHGSPIAESVYEFSSCGGDVSVRLVVAAKQLVVTDQDGQPMPAVELESCDSRVVVAAIVKHLESQDIRVPSKIPFAKVA